MVAVLAGVAADIGGTFVAVTLLGVVVAVTLGLQGTPPEKIEEAFTKVDPDSWLSWLGYALGCVFSVVGGYVCARVARHSEYKLGGIVAAIGVAFGLALGSGQVSPAVDVLLTVLSVVCVMGGAFLGAARNRLRA